MNASLPQKVFNTHSSHHTNMTRPQRDESYSVNFIRESNRLQLQVAIIIGHKLYVCLTLVISLLKALKAHHYTGSVSITYTVHYKPHTFYMFARRCNN